jgi:hypothetical protein
MRARCVSAAVVAAVAVGAAHGQGAPEPQLAKGVAQVQDGYLEDGVVTLAEAGRRISPDPGRRDELAQVYLWLGIAQAQLDSAGAARFSFREAVRLDRRIRLAEGWPPKVVRLFTVAEGDFADQSAEDLARTERSHREAVKVKPRDASACGQLAAFLYQTGRATYDETIAGWDRCAQLSPPDAATHLLFASGYWARAYHDATLDDGGKERYADAGLAQAETAMRLKPDSMDAHVYKGLFLRIKANLASDVTKRAAYEREALRLEQQAIALKARLPAEAGLFVQLAVEEGIPGRVVTDEPAPLPPPPPPPPPPRPRQ